MSAANAWQEQYDARQAAIRAEGRLRTAQEHAARARELLIAAQEAADGFEYDEPPHRAAFLVDVAQVHAQLAVAVALLGDDRLLPPARRPRLPEIHCPVCPDCQEPVIQYNRTSHEVLPCGHKPIRLEMPDGTLLWDSAG